MAHISLRAAVPLIVADMVKVVGVVDDSADETSGGGSGFADYDRVRFVPAPSFFTLQCTGEGCDELSW